MATWILLILMIDGGVDHIEMNSQQSFIEAREPRRRGISGDWEYLTDDAFGFWAMEFNSYSEAREYAKKLQKFRPYKLRLLVVKKCDVWDHE